MRLLGLTRRFFSEGLLARLDRPGSAGRVRSRMGCGTPFRLGRTSGSGACIGSKAFRACRATSEQSPKIGNTVRGRNPDGVEERRRGTALMRLCSRIERRAVRHPGDRVGLYQFLAVRPLPDAPRIAGHAHLDCRLQIKAVHIGPLLNNFFSIDRLDGGIRIAVPDRDPGPRPLVRRSSPHQFTPFLRRTRTPLENGFQALLQTFGATVRNARNDCAAGEYLRIAGQHHGGHRTSGRGAGHVDPVGIDSVVGDHLANHLPDRQRLAAFPLVVFGPKPVEAAQRIIVPLLLREQ